MSSQPSVTVVGLGGMGSALARSLLRRDHDVVVWNRTSARADPLVAVGARWAGSVAQAVAASPLVVICVLDHPASRALLETPGMAEKLSGKTLVDFTSAFPEQLTTQQAWISSRGGRFLAGGIMSLPAGVGRSDTVMLYAGDGPAFEQHYATLACLGGSLEYLGPDPRSAFHAYSTLGLLVEGTVALFLEVSTVARRYGIPMDRFYRLTQIARDTLHFQIRDCADRVLSQQIGGEEASIDLHLHFVQELTAAFAKTGIPVKMTEAFMAQLALASARGYGNNDLAALYAALSSPR